MQPSTFVHVIYGSNNLFLTLPPNSIFALSHNHAISLLKPILYSPCTNIHSLVWGWIAAVGVWPSTFCLNHLIMGDIVVWLLFGQVFQVTALKNTFKSIYNPNNGILCSSLLWVVSCESLSWSMTPMVQYFSRIGTVNFSIFLHWLNRHLFNGLRMQAILR